MCVYALEKKKKKKVVKRRESGGGKEQCSFCVLCNPGPGRKKQPKRTSDKSGYQWQQHWWARHRPLIFFLHIHLSLPKPFILTSLTYICSASWRPLHLSPPVFILTTLSTLKHPPTTTTTSLLPRIKVRQIPWAVGSLHPSNNEAFVGLDS